MIRTVFVLSNKGNYILSEKIACQLLSLIANGMVLTILLLNAQGMRNKIHKCLRLNKAGRYIFSVYTFLNVLIPFRILV